MSRGSRIIQWVVQLSNNFDEGSIYDNTASTEMLVDSVLLVRVSHQFNLKTDVPSGYLVTIFQVTSPSTTT